MGFVLALLAFIFEVFHWLSTRDSDLLFYALVLVTVAILIGPALSFVQGRRSS
jgi:hypothetical protein